MSNKVGIGFEELRGGVNTIKIHCMTISKNKSITLIFNVNLLYPRAEHTRCV